MNKRDDEEPYTPPERPPSYPLDEALEQAYAPPPGSFTLPGHTDDDEYREEDMGETPPPAHSDGSKEPAAPRRRSKQRPTRQNDTPKAIQDAITLLEAHGIPLTPELAKAKEAASRAPHAGEVQAGDSNPVTGDAGNPATSNPVTGTACNPATEPAWDGGDPPEPQNDTPARPQQRPPEALETVLGRLQRWKANYVLALMELGGNQTMACTRRRVSMDSVDEHLGTDPRFAEACAMAVKHSDGVLDAALFRAATIGDLRPKYQGGLMVGYERVRDTRAAELILKLRGRLNAHSTKEVTVKGSIHVAQVTDEDLAAVAQRVNRALFDGNRGRPVIDIQAQQETIGDG